MPEYRTPAGVFLFGIFLPTLLLAQARTDCKEPQTQIEMNICAGVDYKAADAELNTIYNEAIAQMKELDTELTPVLNGAEKTLREAQRAWITYRDKACESHGFLARGGSMESMLTGNCLAVMTRQRINDLKALTGGLE